MSTRWIWVFVFLFVLVRGQAGIVRMKTDFTTDTNQLQVEPTGTSLTFRVRAKNDATIALFNNWTHPTEAYELLIGGWQNRRSVLRRKQQGPNKGETWYTDPFLDQNAFKDFWARWGNGLIAFGRGAEIGKDSILAWTDPNPRAVAMVAIANGYGSNGTWEIPQQAAKRIKIKTPIRKTHDLAIFSTTKVNKFSFSVKACKNVFLALPREFGKTPEGTYEIVIGWDNSESVIRFLHIPTESTQTPDILNCNAYRPFWLTWRQGFIRVGKGTDIGSEVFMQHNFSDPYTINAVTITTFGSVGRWQFNKPTVCSTGTWGLHCAFRCSVGCNNVCNGETGTCLCKDGWFGPHCNISCSSNCVDTRSCDKQHGHCLCKPGYQPSTCESECPNGYWGAGCTEVCWENCANKYNCSTKDGMCTCKPGFRGVTCNQTCDDGTFGFNCEGMCHCKRGHDDCSKVNGTCDSGQCVEGREGVACQMLSTSVNGQNILVFILPSVVGGAVLTLLIVRVVYWVLRWIRSNRSEGDKRRDETTYENCQMETSINQNSTYESIYPVPEVTEKVYASLKTTLHE